MADEGVAVPTFKAMRSVKMPPLVHPNTLASAVKHCISFGGNKESLNAAALAGALIQARMLNARKYASPEEEQDEALAKTFANPDLSEAAKKAMAAAQATNLEKKNEAEEPNPSADPCAMGAAHAVAHYAAAARQHQEQAKSQLQQQVQQQLQQRQAQVQQQAMAAAATMPGFGPGGPMGGIPGGPPFVGANPLASMAMALASVPPIPQIPSMATLPTNPLLPNPLLPNPLLGPTALPPPALDSAEARVVPAKRPHPVIQHHQPPMSEPAPWEQPEEKPKKKENPLDMVLGSLEYTEGEAARCHLHKKPQFNCRTCRRVHADLLGSGLADSGKREKRHIVESIRGRDESLPYEAFEVSNKQTFNFNAMLREQILKSTYFKSLMNIENFEGVVDELYQYAESAEVYGAGTTTVPSTFFCCLFRLFTIGISADEVMQLVHNQESAYIRCCGFLYIRFGAETTKLWE
jgi:pre-mRNA-splicing factor 38B